MAKKVPVNIRYDGPLQIIEFDYPRKKNAIKNESYHLITSSLEEAVRREDITVTVFTGAGAFYSSGNDMAVEISGNMEDAIDSNLAIFKKFIDTLIDYPKILVAVVNGPAIGVACTMLPLMDAVYAHENATFQTPFTSIGICPEACSSYLFPLIMGKATAARMLYFSEKIGAPEAWRRGLVTEIYTNIDKEYVWSKLSKIGRLPRMSLMESKKLVQSSLKEHLHKVNAHELSVLTNLLKSDEFFELLTAKFMNKASKL